MITVSHPMMALPVAQRRQSIQAQSFRQKFAGEAEQKQFFEEMKVDHAAVGAEQSDDAVEILAQMLRTVRDRPAHSKAVQEGREKFPGFLGKMAEQVVAFRQSKDWSKLKDLQGAMGDMVEAHGYKRDGTKLDVMV